MQGISGTTEQAWRLKVGVFRKGAKLKPGTYLQALKKKLTRKNYFRIETKVVIKAISLQSKIQPFFKQQTM